MAFNIRRFTRVSLAFNTGVQSVVLNPSSSSISVNGPAVFTYASADDTVATIAAANYFNPDSAIYDLRVGDLIITVGSTSSTILQVDAVSLTASPKTISTVSFTVSGSVDTANIVDGAVTNDKVNAAAAIAFSKLATLSSGNLLVGSAGGVVTSVASSGDVTIIASGATAIGANKVLSSMLSPLLVKYATVALTASQFTNMYTTPVQLVAAPGANQILIIDQVQLLMTYVGANYASGGAVAIQWDDTANGAGVIVSTTLANTVFQSGASTGYTFNKGVVAETFSTCVNKGLFISNITGVFTTGDSTFVAHVQYRILPTT